MNKPYAAYLDLLDEIRRTLASLTVLAHEKASAVWKDDLTALEAVLKQEQALFLTMRGLEQKKADQLTELGLSDLPLAQLYTAYPPELQLRAKETAENLKCQFQIYRGAAEVARNTLECNLHEIDRALEGMGCREGSIGYAPAGTELPHGMKTDFRA